MNPLPGRDIDGEQETGFPRNEQRHVVALAGRVDAMAKVVGQARDDVSGVAHDVRALRQEVYALRAGVEELLRRNRPPELPPQPPTKLGAKWWTNAPPQPPTKLGTTRRAEFVYLAAGFAVAAVAVLLAIYLFTGT